MFLLECCKKLIIKYVINSIKLFQFALCVLYKTYFERLRRDTTLRQSHTNNLIGLFDSIFLYMTDLLSMVVFERIFGDNFQNWIASAIDNAT